MDSVDSFAGSDTPYFNPMHNHPEVTRDYSEMQEILEEIESRPRQEQPRRFWDVNRHKIEFRKEDASAKGLPKYDTEDGTFALVNGKAIRLCYDCNTRLPYYKGQCMQCRQEYSRMNMARTRAQRFAELSAERGGKCEWCGHTPNPNDELDKLYISLKDEFKGQLKEAREILTIAHKNYEKKKHMVQVLCRECNRWRKRGVNTRQVMLNLIYENDQLRKDIRY